MRIIFLFIITLLVTPNCFPQKNIDKEKLLEYFDFAVQELKLQHQGCYNYIDKPTTDSKIFTLRNRIGSSMTKLEFYELLRQLLGLMNEGHGSVVYLLCIFKLMFHQRKEEEGLFQIMKSHKLGMIT